MERFIKFIPLTVLAIAVIIVTSLSVTHVLTPVNTNKVFTGVNSTNSKTSTTDLNRVPSTSSTTVEPTTTSTLSTTTSTALTTTTSIPPAPAPNQLSVGCVSQQTLAAWFPGTSYSFTNTFGYPESINGNFEMTNSVLGCYLNKNTVSIHAGSIWSEGVGNGTETQGVYISMDWWIFPPQSYIFIPVPNPVESNPLWIVSVNPVGDVLTLEPSLTRWPMGGVVDPNPNMNYYFSVPLGKFIS